MCQLSFLCQKTSQIGRQVQSWVKDWEKSQEADPKPDPGGKKEEPFRQKEECHPCQFS